MIRKLTNNSLENVSGSLLVEGETRPGVFMVYYEGTIPTARLISTANNYGAICIGNPSQYVQFGYPFYGTVQGEKQFMIQIDNLLNGEFRKNAGEVYTTLKDLKANNGNIDENLKLYNVDNTKDQHLQYYI